MIPATDTSYRRVLTHRGERRGPRQPTLPFSGRTPTARAASLAGAQAAEPRAGTQAQRVLEVIRSMRTRGATDWDIKALTAFERSSICARRNALLDAGLVVDSGRTREAGPWKSACTVYVAREYAGAAE